jgi:hypothetical protein
MSELPDLNEMIELARATCLSAVEVRSRSARIRTTSQATRRVSRALRQAHDATGRGTPETAGPLAAAFARRAG